MRLSLCNEVLRDWPLTEQCAYAAGLGYDGLELAPFTLGPDPRHLDPAAVRSIRRTVEDAGLAVTGLHWLLMAPNGLSITEPDPDVQARTRAVMLRLVDLCAELGGTVLVHGSPRQRALPEDPDAAGRARDLALAHWRAAGDAAEAAGVTYCIEPLAPSETNFVTTVAEAAGIVRMAGSKGLATMIDASAAAQAEAVPVAELIRAWLPSGLVRHVHLNARNRQGPGQGEEPFAPVIRALREGGYEGVLSVEPFAYVPDGPGSAARAAGYVRGLLEATA